MKQIMINAKQEIRVVDKDILKRMVVLNIKNELPIA